MSKDDELKKPSPEEIIKKHNHDKYNYTPLKEKEKDFDPRKLNRQELKDKISEIEEQAQKLYKIGDDATKFPVVSKQIFKEVGIDENVDKELGLKILKKQLAENIVKAQEDIKNLKSYKVGKVQSIFNKVFHRNKKEESVSGNLKPDYSPGKGNTSQGESRKI